MRLYADCCRLGDLINKFRAQTLKLDPVRTSSSHIRLSLY